MTSPTHPPRLDNIPADLRLIDLAEVAHSAEAREWGEEPGLNLYLSDTLELVRHELEKIPLLQNSESTTRPRFFMVTDSLENHELLARLQHLGRVADVYILAPGAGQVRQAGDVWLIPLAADIPLVEERSLVVQSDAVSLAFLIRPGEQLDDDNFYYAGYLLSRPEDVAVAGRRLADALRLPPVPLYRPNFNLLLSWYNQLNTLLLERLESTKLSLTAQTREFQEMAEERNRLENMARDYVGGQAWNDMRQAVEQGHTAVEEWREELTICFCDLVGFTPLSERLHPSEVAGILNDHFTKLYQIVINHQGWVDKFIGDAMLAIFSDPTQAMLAAQDMVRESRKVRINEAMEIPVAVRVGLNTGLVAVANLGVSEHRERTVLGSVVNLTQRLQSVAQPHTVLIHENTYQLLSREQQNMVDPTEVRVKGIQGAVRSYEWTLQSHRNARERGALRDRLSNATRRAPLSERIRGKN